MPGIAPFQSLTATELHKKRPSERLVRVEATMEKIVSAADFIPAEADWRELKAASEGCQGCPLFKGATQTVFGEGRVDSTIVMVGEAPGKDEDIEGRPFVGAAGRLLDKA